MKVKMAHYDEFAEAVDPWGDDRDDESAELVGNLILRIARMSVNELELMTRYADRLISHRKEAA